MKLSFVLSRKKDGRTWLLCAVLEKDRTALGSLFSGARRAAARSLHGVARPAESYLVDPASSHTLVLKIKPCMSKCSVLLHTRLRTAHYNSYSLFDGFFSVDNRGNSRANTC